MTTTAERIEAEKAEIRRLERLAENVGFIASCVALGGDIGTAGMAPATRDEHAEILAKLEAARNRLQALEDLADLEAFFSKK